MSGHQTSRCRRLVESTTWSIVWAATLFLFATRDAQTQLAITEVMPSAWTNAAGVAYPDFWELTNFGTNTVNLNGYRFTDSASIGAARSEAFNGLEIQPGESIIFSRENPGVYTNESQFRDWWGDANLGGVRIVVVPGTDPSGGAPPFPGLGRANDAVQLWDSSNRYVDSVIWTNASEGFTFSYSPVTGEFPITSEEGICNAFIAVATGRDVGSPGRHCDPVALRFGLEPTNTMADAGTSVTLSALAYGFPRPRFQWYFNGEVILEGTNSSLSRFAVTPSNAGPYYVVITNGLNVVTSRVATVTVNTNARPCELVGGLSDLTVTVDEEPTFSVITRGYPLCQYQWYFNGSPLPGQTGPSLEVGPVTFESSGDYTVVASNDFATCTASAKLMVVRKPRLYITEVMAWPPPGHPDWWELTNYDTNAVQLLGYRFDDTDGTFGGAFTITNSLVIAPGESVIFAERTRLEEFRRWWGAENLPQGLQVVPYEKFGLSEATDMLRLWNATATQRHLFVSDIAYAFAVSNVTFRFQPTWPSLQEDSVVGQHGAFFAANGGTVGSPGYTTNPLPQITAIQRAGNDTVIRWRAPAGTSCRLETKDTLVPGPWTSVGSFLAEGWIMIATNATAGRQRFYRLAGEP